MENFTVSIVPYGGGTPVELTPEADSTRFATMSIGGFGSCAFTVPLSQVNGGTRRVPKLSHMALYHGSTLLWEGRIEDHEIDVLKGTIGITGFGYQRLLDDVSLKRIWIMRSIGWQLVTDLEGTGLTYKPQTWFASSTGRFDASDLTRQGVLLSAQSNEPATALDGTGAWFYGEAPMVAILFNVLKVGSDGITIRIYSSTNGSSWTQEYTQGSPSGTPPGTAVSQALTANTTYIRLTAHFTSNVTGANVAAEFDTIRILGTQTTEDTTGGLYPQTVLTDLLAQVPGLVRGIIDNDTTFAIPQLSRSQRDKARSVIEEVSSYYLRRWGVWEDKRLDWKAVNLDEPHFVIHLDQLDACTISSSVDNVSKTMYLTYQEAGSGLPKEASVASSDQQNPWVKAGQHKDEILQAPVAMTSTSASRLADRILSDFGSLPAIRGRIQLPAFALVESVVGPARPACYLRAGMNVVIPELPKDDHMRTGRDGQTLFHITATEVRMDEAMVTLELDGYTRSAEILLSRIAGATRVLTG